MYLSRVVDGFHVTGAAAYTDLFYYYYYYKLLYNPCHRSHDDDNVTINHPARLSHHTLLSVAVTGAISGESGLSESSL